MEDNEKTVINDTPFDICSGVTRTLVVKTRYAFHKAKIKNGKKIAGDLYRAVSLSGLSGEAVDAKFEHWSMEKVLEKPSYDTKAEILIRAGCVAVAYACQGIDAEGAGDLLLAWQYTAKAQYWKGCVMGAWGVLQIHNIKAGVELAKLATEFAKKCAADHGRDGALLRLSKDKKQIIKKEAKEYWVNDRDRYKSRADFARCMLDKFPDDLENQAVIEKWSREWDRHPSP
jgi:hypothetical protein